MSLRKRGWNAQELADAGLRTEDGEPELRELIGEDDFMTWRDQLDAINLKGKEHQRELGRCIVAGEDMKAIAGEVVDQRFKHSVYAAAAEITGYTINTIKGFATVARNVSEEMMNDFPTLSFAHLKLVAKFSQEPDRQRTLLTEMVIGNYKVGHAREVIRLKTEGPTVAKSKADKHAERIIAHCSHLLRELGNYNLGIATPKLQEALLRKAEETSRVLKDVRESLTPVGEVA
jgi:hypothetical protein